MICGHVPGFNAWLVAAALGLDYIDAAANGRGHPTVKMGGMGLASRPDLSITQIASSGSKAENNEFAVAAEGDIVRTSNVMRQAAVINGGLIYAARGPLTAGFIKENGAAGAITFQLDLGRAMLAASGADRVRATVDFLGGELLVEGEVTQNTVQYGGGFDLGQMTVRGKNGEAVLGVYNEFMTADFGGKRVATFPDMIGTLDPADRRGGVDFGIQGRQPRRRHHRAPVEISGRQGRARSRGISRGREGHGRRHAVVSLRKGKPIMLRLYDSRLSGNAWKVRILLTQLGIPFERVTLDLAKGATADPAFRAKSRFARVPVLELEDGRTIVESAAIMLYLAEGTPLLPDDRYLRAEVMSWLTFEQADLLRALALPRFYNMRGIADQMESRIADFQEGAYVALAQARRMARQRMIGWSMTATPSPISACSAMCRWRRRAATR